MPDIPLIWGRVRDYVTAGLAIALAVTTLGWYITDLKLDKERLGRKNDRVLFEKAQKEAETLHLEQKIEKEKQYDAAKEKADRDYSSLLSRYNAALVQYKAYQRPSSSSDLPRQAEASDSSAGGTSDSLILVPESDLLICAINTAKVVTTYNWLKELEKTD